MKIMKPNDKAATSYKLQATGYSRGMTLIEALVWIAIFVTAMLALTSSVLYFYRTSDYAIDEASATASAQQGIDRMVRIIREASYASDGAYPVLSIAPDDFVFYADVDTDTQIEKVHFYISGTTLVEGVVNPTGDPPGYTDPETTSSIAEYVHNADYSVILFTYYDEDGNEVTDFSRVADVRFVTVSLVVDVNPLRSPSFLTLRSSAAMRNLIGK
ncbi:MAG: hypothetical protein U1D26_00905 [Patescibacteria group bacterium]|nr:hypothetical protein [bacterium]MDZ4227017.1 hypothetical protein [Patescibacteria group bacterium]